MKDRALPAIIGVLSLAIATTGIVRVATHSSSHTSKASRPVIVPVQSEPSASPSPSETPTAKPKPVSYPKAWDPRVLSIVKFDEQHRGLTYKHPVPVYFLGNAAFNKEVETPAAETKQDEASLDEFVGTLRALGLVTGPLDLAKEENQLESSEVIGLYVPDKHAVFVRGTQLTPYVRVTLAHELTHVLQDQYFDITKLKQSAPGGDDTAVTALIEGDAVRIQNEYEKALSPSDQQLYLKEAQAASGAGDAGSAGVPEILSDFLSFPYAFGPVLLDTLAQSGGNDAIDNAFRHPPSEEAQVLDPVAHPVTEQPLTLPAPTLPAGSRRLDKPGPFGQVSLFEVLGSRIPYAEAWNAVSSWAGDTSVDYRRSGRDCEAIDVQSTSSSAAGALESASKDWASHVPGAQVSLSGSTVSLRSCDPGSSGTAVPATKPSAFAVLEARAAIIEAFLEQNQDYTTGACVADGVIARLGPPNYGALTAENPSAAQISEIQSAAAQARSAC